MKRRKRWSGNWMTGGRRRGKTERHAKEKQRGRKREGMREKNTIKNRRKRRTEKGEAGWKEEEDVEEGQQRGRDEAL